MLLCVGRYCGVAARAHPHGLCYEQGTKPTAVNPCHTWPQKVCRFCCGAELSWSWVECRLCIFNHCQQSLPAVVRLDSAGARLQPVHALGVSAGQLCRTYNTWCCAGYVLLGNTGQLLQGCASLGHV